MTDGSACLSERGTAKLLGVDHMHLKRMATNSVKVTAKNSPYQGRNISVYDSLTIENLIRSYVFALANDKLRKNQIHIGKRCAILQSSLVRSALKTAIQQSCGITPNIQ